MVGSHFFDMEEDESPARSVRDEEDSSYGGSQDNPSSAEEEPQRRPKAGHFKWTIERNKRLITEVMLALAYKKTQGDSFEKKFVHIAGVTCAIDFCFILHDLTYMSLFSREIVCPLRLSRRVPRLAGFTPSVHNATREDTGSTWVQDAAFQSFKSSE